MSKEFIRVRGLAELDRAFRQLRTEVLREMRPELRKAGELVRAEGQALFNRIDTRSAAGYKVRVRKRGVAVEQSLPRVTGLRGDYGALQMAIALEPALASKGPEAEAIIDKLVDKSIRNAGL